jgi:hypothetical protein
LGISLVTAPAVAQQGSSSNGAGHSFGSTSCPQRVQCPNGGDLSSADLVANANSCITRYFGYTSSSGFFDEGAGLDNNNCLSALPNILPKGVGQQLSPVCCILQLPDSTCTFHCDLITIQ